MKLRDLDDETFQRMEDGWLNPEAVSDDFIAIASDDEFATYFTESLARLPEPQRRKALAMMASFREQAAASRAFDRWLAFLPARMVPRRVQTEVVGDGLERLGAIVRAGGSTCAVRLVYLSVWLAVIGELIRYAVRALKGAKAVRQQNLPLGPRVQLPRFGERHYDLGADEFDLQAITGERLPTWMMYKNRQVYAVVQRFPDGSMWYGGSIAVGAEPMDRKLAERVFFNAK